MAGINYLYEEYKKFPDKIEKLLSETIEITEKLDGSRFLVQANEGGTLSYFKRKDMSITKIDRTLSKYYEKAISHFENFPEEKISDLPEGWRFGMEYFPNLQPVTISYDRLPLNNLVLTDIQVKDPRDKTIEVITDRETLNTWADVLEVEKPPIIFEGKLDNSQKRRLLDFLNTPYNDLITRFKTESFTTFILNLLNPELKKSFMHNDSAKDIDGLVFKFNGKESYRISNPEVSLMKSQRSEEKPSDIYNLTLVVLQEFLTSLDFNKIKLQSKTYEERYIEFICKVFNLFLNTPQYKESFENGVDFELPKFLSKEEFNVNFKFVKDPETLSALEKSNTNRELFKILLASMRSHKKKPSGFFTKELIFHHNELVDKIADFVDYPSKSLKEASFFSFQEFKKVFLTENANWQEEFGQGEEDTFEKIDLVSLNEEKIFPTYDEVHKSKTLDLVSKPLIVMKRILGEETVNDSKKKTPVCLMMGKFQPFHNGHASSIEDATKASGMKVFLVVTNKRLPGNFSQSLHKSIMEEVVNTDKNVCGYIFTDGRSIKEVIKQLPGNYSGEAFAGSEDECFDVNIQSPELKTFPMTKHISTSQVIKRVKDEDYDNYRKLVPAPFHNFFYKIRNEVK